LDAFIYIMDKNQISIYKSSVLSTCITHTSIDIKVLLHFERNMKTKIVNRL